MGVGQLCVRRRPGRALSDLSHTFGRSRVEPDQREQLIRRVFRQVAPRYDLMNDLMSFGIHRLWKRDFGRQVNPRAGETIVDLAGGTGDIAALLGRAGAQVLICDPGVEMMRAGRARGVEAVGWLAGVGERLPIIDCAADALTIAFGIRNMTRMDAALAEIFRILKPGGRFLCLEFSRPAAPIRPVYEGWSRLVIPRLGAWVAGNPEAYRYLIESIEGFPDQAAMAALIEQAGFVDVRWRNLSFGIACIHSGRRPLDAAR